MKTSEVLNTAANLIEERGWTTGNGWVTDEYTGTMPLCLEGGIMAALGITVPESSDDDRVFEPLVTCPAYRAVTAYLGRDEVGVNQHGFTGQPLYWWNDGLDEETGAEQVIATLRAAAVIEAAKENTDVREPVSA